MKIWIKFYLQHLVQREGLRTKNFMVRLCAQKKEKDPRYRIREFIKIAIVLN